MFVSILLALQQLSPADSTVVQGRIVSELTGAPLAGARLKPASNWGDVAPAVTDETGRYSFEPKPDTTRRRRLDRALDQDELEVSADLHAVLTVDTSSRAPWANEVPVRGTQKFAGIVHGANAGQSVHLVLRPDDFVWPPQTGLAISLDPRRAYLDADGRFEFEDVPVNTALNVLLSLDYKPIGVVALTPGSADVIEMQAPAADKDKAPSAPESYWQTIDAVPVDATGRSRFAAWFDVLPESRHKLHRNGGGRWHVHGNLPCNCLEAQAGTRVLVARDRDGWIGVLPIQVSDETIGKKHRVVLAPGGLLRLHFGKGVAASRVSLRANGLVFATRDVAGDAIWYELAPKGAVDVLMGTESGDRTVRTITVEPGTVARVAIEK